LRRLGYDSRELWAWANYRPVVVGFADMLRQAGRVAEGRVRVLEIGGGRDPLFTPEEAAVAGIALTVNDIDAHELSLGPQGHDKALFDIAGEAPHEFGQRFDLVISKMVLEHVKDARRAWANMGAILAPGGVAMAFHPTLFATPYLINLALPERVTAPLLELFFRDRNRDEYPKFPARYDLCRGDQQLIEPELRRAGFREALVAPFWGHRYYRHLPGLRDLVALSERFAEARDWRLLTTYAYTVARR